MAKEKKQVFQVRCPCCESLIWVDPIAQEVVQIEKKGGRKKESLDELLTKEKKRRGEMERKFEATAELAKKKREKAEEGFKKAFIKTQKEE
jgi:hypothetical protein